MRRRALAVRPLAASRVATQEDVPVLLTLWSEQREVTPRADRTMAAAGDDQLRVRLGELCADPDARILVGELEGDAVGAALLVRERLAPLAASTAVHVHYLHVDSRARGRGVGHALLAGAVTYAEECGAEQIVANVSPQVRDANRFYARLGFGAVLTRRVSFTCGLRRRMLPQASEGTLSDVLARRRALRARSQLRALAGP